MRRRAGAVWHWLAGHQFVAALILIGGLTAAALWRDQALAARDRGFIQCVAAWGDDVSNRSVQLARDGNIRADALDLVLRNVFEQMQSGSNNQGDFRRLLSDYVTASDTYRVTVATNPVPAPPRIRC